MPLVSRFLLGSTLLGWIQGKGEKEEPLNTHTVALPFSFFLFLYNDEAAT